MILIYHYMKRYIINCYQNVCNTYLNNEIKGVIIIKEFVRRSMNTQRKSVQIYLRVKGPLNRAIKPQFKLLADDTKIRFKEPNQTQQQSIVNEYAGIGTYKFTKIFRENCQQEDIYKKVAQDLVQSAIEGYNGTIFAYGQTGSGKTYTMTGGDDDPSEMGIIPRVIDDFYKEAQIREQQITIKLKYMQIYKKKGYDLLHPQNKSRKLEELPQVRAFCKADNFQFENLSEHEAPTFQEAMRIYQYGDTNRIVCKTPSNDQSSRSHCILMINVKSKNRDTGLQQKATINLVDLAGSQRVHNVQMDEKQAKQGIQINLGLHYLSRVVLSLGQQSKGMKDIHIPYRESLLTMALKSSMGGNCKTRMIATINPNPAVTPQSIATCKFSQNLLAMQNKLKKNQFINPWDIIKGLKNEVEELKGQISRLKGQNVKEILQREDYIKIHSIVDKFISNEDPATTLPINDRLYIRQYLSYMKTIINKLKKNIRPVSAASQKEQHFETAISQNYILEVKSLRQQIQQKQHQIQLLLTIINHKNKDDPDELEDNVIPIQQLSERRIVQTVANSLNKQKRKKMNVTAEDVQKKLFKPLMLNKVDSAEQAFQMFKDAHIQSEQIGQKQHQIKVKNMKKDVITKKIQKLRCQRTKLSQSLQEIQNKSQNFPSIQILGVGQSKSDRIKELKQQMSEIDMIIKKKYQELKSIQLQVDRLDLCKNKNTKKLKNQFDGYMQQMRIREQTQKQSETISTNEYKQKNIFGKHQENQYDEQVYEQKRIKEKEQNERYLNDQVNKHMEQFFLARRQLLGQNS